jgi:hypothetical protein
VIQPTMPRGVALNILKRRRDGIAVGLDLIEKATDVVRCGYDRRKKTLPALKPSEREHANAVLLFNLGRAIGGKA